MAVEAPVGVAAAARIAAAAPRVTATNYIFLAKDKLLLGISCPSLFFFDTWIPRFVIRLAAALSPDYSRIPPIRMSGWMTNEMVFMNSPALYTSGNASSVL